MSEAGPSSGTSHLNWGVGWLLHNSGACCVKWTLYFHNGTNVIQSFFVGEREEIRGILCENVSIGSSTRIKCAFKRTSALKKVKILKE